MIATVILDSYCGDATNKVKKIKANNISLFWGHHNLHTLEHRYKQKSLVQTGLAATSKVDILMVTGGLEEPGWAVSAVVVFG